ncbi:MAG: SPOR domain-containing protein [Prevotellaceae bacterium]|nr:SPOR domain-containing protein [Prevotellaceae bacterium]
MIELAQHIEALLLDNDCVILPGVGGFITHHTPAARVKGTSTILPPTRLIGFNPQLTMNDGLLTQSYMSVYHTNYSDASRRVERSIKRLIATLHKEGSIHLPHIGEVHYDIHNAYSFTAYDDKITTPDLYGLDSFEIPLLKEKSMLRLPAAEHNHANHFIEIKLNRTYLYRTAAVAAVALFLIFLPTPPTGRQLPTHEYSARLLPEELLKQIETESLSITPVVVRPQTSPPATPVEAVSAQPQTVEQPKPYHIIIASMGNTRDAEAMVSALASEGFADARAIGGNGKVRVAIQSYITRQEAYQALTDIRKNERFRNAWVLKK